jgi:hypothetical protein
MPQFRVVLDQVELSKEQQAQLDRAIQKTVLGFLAGVDTGGDKKLDRALILSPELRGIWIRLMSEGLDLNLDRTAEELNREIAEIGTPRL